MTSTNEFDEMQMSLSSKEKINDTLDILNEHNIPETYMKTYLSSNLF